MSEITATVKYAMISQPMAGLLDTEIMAVRKRTEENLKARGYAVIDTYYCDPDIDELMLEDERALFYLGRTIMTMRLCDVVYFCKGWDNARGCKVEHAVAEAYGLEIIYEEDVPTL